MRAIKNLFLKKRPVSFEDNENLQNKKGRDSEKTIESWAGNSYIQTQHSNQLISFLEYENDEQIIKYKSLLAKDFSANNGYSSEAIEYFKQIGTLYKENKENFPKALQSFQNVLLLQKDPDTIKTLEQADLYYNLSQIYIELSKLIDAQSYANKAFNLRKKLLNKQHEQLADTYLQLGIINFYNYKYDNAQSYFKKSLVIREKIFGENSSEVAEMKLWFGRYYMDQKKSNLAFKYLQDALEIRQKFWNNDSKEVAECLLSMGFAYLLENKQQDALQYFLDAEQILNNKNNSDCQLKGFCYQCIGSSHVQLDNNKLALEYFQKSLDIRYQIYGKYHPKIALLRYYLGKVQFEEKQYREALHSIKEAVDVQKQVCKNKPLEIVKSLNMLGGIYCVMKNNPKALKCYESALEYLQNKSFSFPMEAIQMRAKIALIHFNSENWQKSKHLYKIVYLAMNKNKMNFQREIPLVLINLAISYEYLKKISKAIKTYLIALKYYESVVPKVNIATYKIIFQNLGNIYLQQENYRIAEQYYKQYIIAKETDEQSDELQLLFIQKNLSLIYLKQEKFGMATNLYLKVKEKAHELLSNEALSKIEYIRILNEISTMYSIIKNYEEAQRLLEEAFILGQNIKEDDSSTLSFSSSKLQEIKLFLNQINKL